MKMNVIELLKENARIRVKLKQKFIDFTRRKTIDKYRNIKGVCSIISSNTCSYNALLNWLRLNKKHQTNPLFKDFYELVKILNIPEEVLFNNILGFSLWGSPITTYLPFTIDLTEDVVTAISLYVGDGLTSKRQERVIFTNSDLRLIKFFEQIMLNKCLATPTVELFIYAYSQNPKNINKNFLHEKFSIKSSQIKIYSGGPKRPNYKFGTNNTVRRMVLDLLIRKTKELCLENKKFARAYLKGIFLAEGNIYYDPDRYQRNVAIELADKKEISFIKNLLKMFGIKRKIYKNVRGYYVINIGYRKGLETLRDLKFFNLVKEKQKLLEKMCSSYTSKRSRWWK